MIDMAYAITTRLFQINDQEKFSPKADIADEKIREAFICPGPENKVPDFNNMYATLMCRPYREITKEDLLRELETEPAYHRAARIYDYWNFFMEFVSEHKLQL